MIQTAELFIMHNYETFIKKESNGIGYAPMHQLMNRCICAHFCQSLCSNEWQWLQEKGTGTTTFFIQNPLEYASELETSLQIVINLSIIFIRFD